MWKIERAAWNETITRAESFKSGIMTERMVLDYMNGK